MLHLFPAVADKYLSTKSISELIFEFDLTIKALFSVMYLYVTFTVVLVS